MNILETFENIMSLREGVKRRRGNLDKNIENLSISEKLTGIAALLLSVVPRNDE